jgi:hypothetical protein
MQLRLLDFAQGCQNCFLSNFRLIKHTILSTGNKMSVSLFYIR